MPSDDFVLAGQIGDVQDEVKEISDVLLEWNGMNISSYSAPLRGIRYVSSKWYWCQDGSIYSYTIPITGGKKYKITANNTNAAQYTFLTNNERGSGSQYKSPAFATGYSSVLNIAAGESLEVVAPANATYLYLTQKIGSTVYTPSSLYNQISKIDKLDELETTITENKEETDEEIAELKESMVAWNDMDLLSYSAPLRGILYVSNKWYWTQDNSTYSYTIPITGGESYKIAANDTNNAKYTFLTSNNRGSGYSTPAFATGYSSVLEIPAGEELVVKAPDNAAYLYLTQQTRSVIYTPKAVYNQISKFDVVDELEESSRISYPIDISKCAYKRFSIKTVSGNQYWEGHDYESFSYLIDVTGIQKVRITAATNASAVYTFLKTDNRKADSYVSPNFATGYSSVKSIEAGVTSDEIKVPSDAVYLYLHQYVNSVDHTPSQLLFMLPTVNQVGMNLDNINGLMEDVKETYYEDNKAFYDADFTNGDVSIFNTNANWSVDSNGLTCTNPSNTIYTKHISSMSQKKTRLRFTMSSDGFVALCWANTGSSNGSYFSVDATNGLMSVHNNYNDSTSTPPSILSSANVTIIAGREYILEAIKERHNNTLRLYDGLSGSMIAELIVNQASASAKTGGHQIGNLGIACVSGTVYIKRLQVVFDYIKPLIAVFGDSITEGDKVMQGVTYGDLLKEHFGDSRVVTSGKSGDTADGVTTRIGNEIRLLKPKYVMVTIGTNGGLAKYQLLGILANIHAVGAIPIICVPPLGGTTVPSIRTLLAQYDFLSVRYDIATAVNNDVSQGQNSSIFADGLHPNATGHQAMFDRIKVDVPELFDY